MKVFFGFCLWAISLSAVYALDCPQITCPAVTCPPVNPTPVTCSPVSPTPVTPTPVTPTHPWKPCPNGHGGLLGLLQQIAYLVNNILNNLRTILSACSNNPNGSNILAALRNLLNQVRLIIIALLGGSHLTPAQVASHQGTLQALVQAISNLLNSLLGGGQGTSWCCTRPSGILGISIDGLIASIVNLLNGSWSHDRGLLSGLLGQIISTVSSLLTGLVL